MLAPLFLIYLQITSVFLPIKIQLWYHVISSLTNNLDNTIIILGFVSYILKFLSAYYYIIITKRSLCVFQFNLSEIPSELIVGFNVIHPPLFYSSTLLFLIIYAESLIYIRLIFILIFSVCGLFLGGIWGLGNSVWGFFWVNDLIEVIFLVYVTFILTIMHIDTRKHHMTTLYFTIFSLFFCLLLVRLGFIFTRHNFFNVSKLNNFFFFSFPLLRLQVIKHIHIALYYLFFKLLTPSIFFYYLSKSCKNLTNYRVNFLLIHIFVFLVFLTWIKARENNLVYFTLPHLMEISSHAFDWHSIFNNYYLLRLDTYILRGLYISTVPVYPHRLFTAFYSIGVSYIVYIAIILISIHKIYENYLLN